MDAYCSVELHEQQRLPTLLPLASRLRPDFPAPFFVLVFVGPHLGYLSGHFLIAHLPMASRLLILVNAVQNLQHGWAGLWSGGLNRQDDSTWRYSELLLELQGHA